MNFEGEEDKRPPITRKYQSFLYPESTWPRVNYIPRVNVPFYSGKLDTEHAATSILTKNVPALLYTSTATSDAPSTNSDGPSISNHPDSDLQSEKSFKIKDSLTRTEVTKGSVSGRKRKMDEREKERRQKRRKTIMIARTRLSAAASDSQDAKVSSSVNKLHVSGVLETEMMRYGRLCGYNVVPDFNNYLVVRSAYGYGNISQSSAVTRSSKTVNYHPCDSSKKKTMSPRDRDNLLVRTGGCRRHFTRSDPNNYLVVQSVSGYGNISQSGGAKRISSYSDKTKASLYSTSAV